MILNTRSVSVVGATLLLALSAIGAFAQQPDPKSTKHIPIKKEAGGEVAPRVDTVTRVDTVERTIFRSDTVMQTVVRVDSVLVTPPPRPLILPAGLYLGIASGASAPDGSIFVPNSVGYIGQAQFGWQSASQIYGLRTSGTYTNLGQDSQFSNGINAQLWTYAIDGKLGAPLGRIFGLTPRLNAYAIGGWTYTWFRDMPRRLDTPDNTPTLFLAGEQTWHGRNGWDAGGGLSLTWGHNEVFVESRVMGFSPTNSPEARQIPIIVGFNWY